jgi:hypothetical protein
MPRSRKTKTKTHGNTKALLYISKLKAMHNGKTLKELIKIGIIKKKSYKKRKLKFDKIEERHLNSITTDLPLIYKGKRVSWEFHQLGCWENKYPLVKKLEDYLKEELIDYQELIISQNRTFLTEYFGFENKNCRTEEQVDSYIEYLIDGQIPTSICASKEITLDKCY